MAVLSDLKMKVHYHSDLSQVDNVWVNEKDKKDPYLLCFIHFMLILMIQRTRYMVYYSK